MLEHYMLSLICSTKEFYIFRRKQMSSYRYIMNSISKSCPRKLLSSQTSNRNTPPVDKKKANNKNKFQEEYGNNFESKKKKKSWRPKKRTNERTNKPSNRLSHIPYHQIYIILCKCENFSFDEQSRFSFEIACCISRGYHRATKNYTSQ